MKSFLIAAISLLITPCLANDILVIKHRDSPVQAFFGRIASGINLSLPDDYGKQPTDNFTSDRQNNFTINDPDSAYNGIDMGYGDMLQVSSDLSESGEARVRFAFFPLNIAKWLKPFKDWEAMSQQEKYTYLFGTENGLYAGGFVGAVPTASAEVTPAQAADIDIEEAVRHNARVDEASKPLEERVSTHWSRNWDRWSAGGVGALLGGGVMKGLDSGGGSKNESISIQGDGNSVGKRDSASETDNSREETHGR